MSHTFDRAYWEDRYRGHRTVDDHPSDHWPDPRPNPQLVTEVADLEPGSALDAGCGEGAEAVWLAARGWRVTALDIAAGALERARAYATDALDPAIADRIDWVRADLTDWAPRPDAFDLVCTHYVHPTGPAAVLFRALADSVAPGGTLLIVGHAPGSGPHGSAPHDAGPPSSGPPGAAPTDAGPPPEAHITAGEIAAVLDPERWEIQVAEARPWSADRQHGHGPGMSDAVLRAHRRQRSGTRLTRTPTQR